MSSATATRQTSVNHKPASGSLAEVVDIILDKGLVIDAYVRVSLIGIELLTIDIRVVVASVDTYLHFAEATNRLDIRAKGEADDTSLTDFIGGLGSGPEDEVPGRGPAAVERPRPEPTQRA